MASCGHNGNNETRIGMSPSISLSFYDEKLNEIVIQDQTSMPIEILIKRDKNMPDYSFQYVNVSQIDLTSSSSFLPNAFNLTLTNASLHIELKPLNWTIGYVLVMKLGYTPIINSSQADFTSFRIFCPSQMMSFYVFFQNMSQVNGFKGFVGYSIRELNSFEMNQYCFNNSTQATFDSIFKNRDKTNFTSDFMLRTYSSGCYYYDGDTGKWSSNGIDVYEDTNLTQTHCSSNHLTMFAGGLDLLPTTIDFQFAFANSAPNRNPFIYTTIILVTCVYILFALWSRWMDLRDLKKQNLILMQDNHLNDSYFYEIICFTGEKNESGTNSKVKIFV